MLTNSLEKINNLLLYIDSLPVFGDGAIDDGGSLGEKKVPAQDSNKNLKILCFPLMGQSNMSGRGMIEKIDTTPHLRVKKWDNEIGALVPAVESLRGFDGRGEGVGPGLSFGKKVAETLPNVQIILIPVAVGSTNIKKWQKGKELYENALTQTQNCLQTIKNSQLGGILWHQGESDTTGSKDAKKHKNKLIQLITDFRNDLNNSSLPWICGELGHYLDNCELLRCKYWKKINFNFHQISESMNDFQVVSAEGLNPIDDQLHLNSHSQRMFGERYAQVYMEHYSC